MTQPYLDSVSELEALFGQVGDASRRKEVPVIHPVYRRWIEASPFAVLATSGAGETLRVNGKARISVRPELLERLALGGAKPLCVLEIDVETVFFQCARAMQRSKLWAPVEGRPDVPTAGEMLEALTEAAIDGGAYDRELPARQRATLY